MLNLLRNTFCVLIILFVLVSCSKTDRSDQVAAKIGSEQITYDRVDQLISEQLYESLFQIYYKRKIALDELVANQLLEKEGKARGISRDSLLQIVVNQKMKFISIDSFAQVHALKGGIPNPSKPLDYLPFESQEGQNELKRVLSIKLKDDFVANLKTKYGVEIMLNPPQVPMKNLSGIEKEVSGDKESKTSITIIGDIDCSSCAEYQPVFDSLMKKYSDRVRFEYINLTTMSSLRSILAEYAFIKGKYSNFVAGVQAVSETDSLKLVDAYERVVNEKMNTADFQKVKENAFGRGQMLTEIGIHGTPTILINNRIYYGIRSVKAISEFIEEL